MKKALRLMCDELAMELLGDDSCEGIFFVKEDGIVRTYHFVPPETREKQGKREKDE